MFPVSGHRLWLRACLALLAGACIPLSLSPLDLWPFGFLGAAGLYLALHGSSAKQGAGYGWLFGLGLFAVGSSWVHVSIATYGNVGPLLSALITGLFILLMACFVALPCWLMRRYYASGGALVFAVFWIMAEWLRSWFLTGFPWLYLGYGHLQGPLSSLAPVFGVMGISFVVALSGAALASLLPGVANRGQRRQLALILALAWSLALLLSPLRWVTPEGPTLRAGIVHGTIPQEDKFDPGARLEHLAYFEDMSQALQKHELILWPETAIAFFQDSIQPLLDMLDEQAAEEHTTLISGIFAEEDGAVHNSILALGQGRGIYHKQKLVPFGEYVPMEAVLGPVMQLFDLPMSTIHPGPRQQPLLQADTTPVAPFICYEIVYPDFVRRQAAHSALMVTISNDTWFGASWGPRQHLQMAAMRALENGRYLLRSTNNGISAIIDERGRILARTPQFSPQTLSAEVQPFSGRTPFSRWGSWPLLLLCAFLLILAAPARRRKLP